MKFDAIIDYTILLKNYENNAGKPNDFFYHYTDISGVKGILGKKVLWATLASHLNDKNELSHSRKLINQQLENLITTSNPNQKLYLDAIRKKFIGKTRYDFYICSFSEEKDFTPQYQKYTSGETRICLEFDYSQLLARLPVPTLVSKVIYDENLQNSIITAFIRQLEIYMNNLSLKFNRNPKEDKDFIEFAVQNLDFLVPLFKTAQWSSEKEVRIIIPRKYVTWYYTAKINRRGNKDKTFYLEIPIKSLYLHYLPISKIYYISKQTKKKLISNLQSADNKAPFGIPINKSNSDLKI